MTELYYAEDDPNIAGMVKAYLERKNIKCVSDLINFDRYKMESQSHFHFHFTDD